ncbi:uncharacterized protein LOC135147649 [Daucus carota subsp. sativus]|uniref:uncharacterized protein LOC135147649 n=1 Tax=Daucus carota subsp. sativus TaxID=79200 RepID=UPI0030835E66
MDGYVNVNFFWGGKIIKQDNDVLYTLDPKEMMYVKLSSSLEELRDMSVKSDDDVRRMLSIPERFHLGGDVSLFIEAESIAQPSQHYGGEYGGNYGQTGQTAAGGQVSNYVENYGWSFGGDYGGNYGQSQGMQGWSSGYNYGTIGEYGGGSSNTGRFVVEEVVDEDDLSG